jgi:type IV pilus assembly protein PilY1
MAFSIPSDVFALDRNLDGDTDRLYVGDLGGNMWRFNVGNSSPSNWEGKKIFASNPGEDTTNGRKIFYKPDVTFLDSQNSMVYFGTGDREHPQNYLNPGAGGAVVDRFYAFRDNDLASTVRAESELVDVTENILQQDVDQSEIVPVLNELNDPSKFGWYIKLNAASNDGEKVLAPASVFNQVAFFTTYQPYTVAQLDSITTPCLPGNLGTSRLYAVNYLTGEAVYNFNGDNDTAASNKRAQGVDKDGNTFTLRRSDREFSLGGGIPSGIVFIIGADGKVTTVTSADASFPALTLDGDGVIFPVYWVQW